MQSVRKGHHPSVSHPSENSRNQKKERNFSAMLPRLDRPRYEEREAQELNIINFVKASRRQMKDVINVQQPKAQKFFDEGLNKGDSTARAGTKELEMPNFTNSQIARLRPSIHSVSNSVNRKLQLSLPKMDEESDMASSRAEKRPLHLENISALISPKALSKNVSKASLVTDSYHVGANASMSAPGSVHTTNRKKTNSPSQQSMVMQAFGRELKHLNKYFDAREMQLRTDLEGTQKLDARLEHNHNLQELYHQMMFQVRSKLPQNYNMLDDIVKRIMDGLSECFELQNRAFIKKIDIRNKKIDGLRNELEEVKEQYAEFKRESTIDAFFKKHTDIVDRTGRRAKDYMKDLNKQVDSYLETTDDLEAIKMDNERQAAKEAEPSGVDSLLIQLQQVNRNLDIPGAPENPLAPIDAEKESVMKDFRRALNKEANSMRYAVEQHVKGQLGLVKPTSDAGCQTLTYNRLKQQIEEGARYDIELEIQKQMEEKFDIRTRRWMKELDIVEKKNANMKDKLMNLQQKLQKTDGDTYVEVMREKIIAFFNIKLGKKSDGMLREFNEKIMEIKNHEFSVNKLLKSVSSIHETESELARLKAAQKFDHLIKSSSSRPSLASNDLVKVIDRQGSMNRSQDSDGSVQRAELAKEINSPNQVPQTQGVDSDTKRRPTTINVSNKKSVKKSIGEEQDEEYGDETKRDPSRSASKQTRQKSQSPPRTATGQGAETPAEQKASNRSRSQSLTKTVEGAQDDNQSAADVDRLTPFSKKQQSPKGSMKSKRGSEASSPPRGGSKAGSPEQKGSAINSEGATSPPLMAAEPIQEVDDRKELMKDLDGIKNVVKTIKDFQGPDKLKFAAKKAEKAVDIVAKVAAAADILFKIIKLNAEDDSLKSEAADLNLAAGELSLINLVPIRKTLEKINKGKEMHKQIEKVNKFIKDVRAATKKGKGLPARDKIMDQVRNLEEIKKQATDLPMKDEIEQISNSEKKGNEIDGQLTDMVTKKLVKAPATAVSAKSAAVSAKSAAVSTKTIQPATATSKGENEEISDAIASIQLVRSQIEESHSVILNANNNGNQEQKLLSKVNRLLKHMDEAVNWLEQKRIDANAQLNASDSETPGRRPSQGSNINIQEREKSFKAKDGKNKTATKFEAEHETPPLVNSEQNQQAFNTRKQTEPAVSKKMISLQQNAQNYLTANDIDVVIEDTKREQTTSKISSHHREKTNPSAANRSNLGLIGEEDIETEMRDSSKQQLGQRKNSRIEVFRKTPNKNLTVDCQNPDNPVLQVSDSDSTPMRSHPNTKQKENAQEQDGRRQFAELDMENAEMTYTFAYGNSNGTAGGIIQGSKGQIKNLQAADGKHKDIAAALRQSGTETDYLKTASHFGNETFRADLNRMNIGITAASPNPNETQSFLNNLKNQAAIDPRVHQVGGIVTQAGNYSVRQEGSKKTNDGVTVGHMNQDLEDPKNLLEASQGSSIADQDLSYADSPLAHQQPQYSNNSPRHVRHAQKNFRRIGPNGEEISMPSALKISQKPVHAHIKIDDTSQIGALAHDLNVQSQLSTKLYTRKPKGSVLMLTQATQTENRALIKQLLTLINETIMKQLERQSVQMTKDEFDQQVEQLKEAIPAVYDQVKGNSDTFFIEQMLGQNYSTAMMKDTVASNLAPHTTLADNIQKNMNQTPEQQKQITTLQLSRHANMLGAASNQDLSQVMPQQETRQTTATHSTGIGNVVIGKKNLSPSPSYGVLNREISKKELLDQVVGIPQSPSMESLNSQVDRVAKKQPYLSLGDFSRYGNHTLEISQEVRQRVNLRQMGAAGGGFIGRGVKVRPPPEQH